MGAEAGLVATRLARGCRAFAVCRDEQLAGYGWLSTGPEWIGEAGFEIRPGPSEGYIWNCVTLPAYRRQGVFAELLASLVGRAGAEGLTRLWIASLAGTAESAVRRAGFSEVIVLDAGRLARLRLLRLRARRH